MVTFRNSYEVYPRTLWERNVHDIVASIREKEDWWNKYQDNGIFNKWKKEVKDAAESGNSDGSWYRFLGDQIDETFAAVKVQLDYFNKLRQSQFPWLAGHSEDVYYADNVVGKETKDKLKELAAKLEALPKDWHPGSNEQVLDLVHPSLYPIEIGVTKLKNGDTVQAPQGAGDDIEYRLYGNSGSPPFESIDRFKSDFQWIPALFTANDDKVTIDSYINNLHPEHYREYYPVIADIFAKSLPGLTNVLNNAQLPKRIHAEEPPMGDLYTRDMEDKIEEYYSMVDRDPSAAVENGEEMIHHECFKKLRLGWTSYSPCEVTYRLPSNLKVIVKMANIHLTPEKPTYNGGVWHLEGTLLENVVSTVLYYYDTENITNSTLSFRSPFREDFDTIDYAQNDFYGVNKVYGIPYHNDGMPTITCVESAGNVQCIEDRIVVFPNMLQHRVDPFELADKSKPGHRKILAFFVCNPDNENVIASDQVPFQQKEWVEEGASEPLAGKLPPELADMVLDKCDTITKQQALDRRERLMEERRGPQQDWGDYFVGWISLCEH